MEQIEEASFYQRVSRFEVQKFSIDEKIDILSSDSVLIPIYVDSTSGIMKAFDSAEIVQNCTAEIYLVNLEVSKMTVTIYM